MEEVSPIFEPEFLDPQRPCLKYTVYEVTHCHFFALSLLLFLKVLRRFAQSIFFLDKIIALSMGPVRTLTVVGKNFTLMWPSLEVSTHPLGWERKLPSNNTVFCDNILSLKKAFAYRMKCLWNSLQKSLLPSILPGCYSNWHVCSLFNVLCDCIFIGFPNTASFVLWFLEASPQHMTVQQYVDVCVSKHMSFVILTLCVLIWFQVFFLYRHVWNSVPDISSLTLIA